MNKLFCHNYLSHSFCFAWHQKTREMIRDNDIDDSAIKIHRKLVIVGDGECGKTSLLAVQVL